MTDSVLPLTQRVGLEPVLTIDELAALAKVSRRTIERAIADGRLRVVHLSPRAVRITQQAAAAYLAGVDETVDSGGGTVHAFSPLDQGGDRDC